MRYLLIALAICTTLSGNAAAATKKNKARPVPEFSAKSYLIADEHGIVLKEQGMDLVMPIASITKLMISLLAAEQDLDEEVTIPSTRTVNSSIPRNVKFLSRRELITLSMVRSDNFAAQILCANLENCVDKMNGRAQALGMYQTVFIEPTGLDNGNVSTASDLLKLMLEAAQDLTVSSLSSMPNAEIETSGKPIKIRNTNPLTNKFDILLSKTGYTRPAGGCIAMIINAEVGQRIIIMLGSKNARTRVPDMERLVNGLD